MSRLYLHFLPPARARAHLFLFFLTSLSRMPLLMKEIRLTRHKSKAQIYTQDIERERERHTHTSNIFIVRKEGEKIQHRTQRLVPAGLYEFRDIHKYSHITFSPLLLSLSFGFFCCIIDGLCLSSRIHHIELLIVHPTKKEREFSIVSLDVTYMFRYILIHS